MTTNPSTPPSDDDLPTLLTPEHIASAEATYRAITQEFAAEVKVGHMLAYFRTYASPRVSGLLSHTGHVQHAATKRAVDTGLHVYELVHHGIDSEPGRQVIRQMNRMHHHWKIRNDDYTWVLGTFAVLGLQMIDRLAWRALTDDERQAAVDWWREVGTRMGVTDIPETYADFADAFRAYEVKELRRSEAGQQLMDASWAVAMGQLPGVLRPLGRPLVAALTDEPARAALGLPHVGPLTRGAIRGIFLARSLASTRSKAEGAKPFVPGAPAGPYTEGYALVDLGVGDDHRHPNVV